MKACRKCGCTVFFGNQRVLAEVVVDGNNEFLDHAGHKDDAEKLGEAFGPYICTNCGKDYGDLDELPDTDKPMTIVQCQDHREQMLESAIQFLELIKEGKLSDGDWPSIDELIAEFKGEQP